MAACRSRAALAVLAVAAFLSCASATNYTVGDQYGWRRPPANNPGYYAQWSAKYSFFLPDLISFDSLGASSNVVNIGASEYQVCNTSDPGGQYTFPTPVTFRFPEVGDFYFASGIAGDCLAGVKVKITIQASSGGATPPPGRASPPPISEPVPSPPPISEPVPSPPSSGEPVPSPPSSVNYFFVGGEDVGWTIPTSASYYTDWAETVAPLYVDTDDLVFRYDNLTHDVAQLDAVTYSTCDTTNPLGTFQTGGDILRPSDAGTFYFSSSFPRDCSAGMRFSIQYVAGSRPAGGNPPASPPVGGTPPATPPPGFFLPPPIAPVTAPPPAPPTSSAPPPSVPPTAPPTAPPTVPPTSPPKSPPTSLAPPPPPPLIRAPPPPPPPARIPPPPAGFLPPGLTVPPGLSIPPGLTVPPGVSVPPGALRPSGAISGARVGNLLLLAALGLSLLVLT